MDQMSGTTSTACQCLVHIRLFYTQHFRRFTNISSPTNFRTAISCFLTPGLTRRIV